MSIADLKITEVHYNPASGLPPFLEITNTGSTAVAAGDFFVGNSDYGPEYYSVIGPNAILAPSIPAGATIILVPSVPDTSGEVFVPPVPISQAEFEAAYGPLPEGAVYYNYPAFFTSGEPNPYNSDVFYTIGGVDVFGDAVYIPGGALPGQSASVSLVDGSVTIGTPTPGVTADVAVVGPTNGDDVLVGGDAPTTIDLMDGNDTWTGVSDPEAFVGGQYIDSIIGGAGNDSIFGGIGNDDVDGGTDDDLIVLGDGNDHGWGGEGDDEMYGGTGKDYVNGNSGHDQIYGDKLVGGAGDDVIYGGASHDKVNGNSGDDILFGGSGKDNINGGAGDDELYGGGQTDNLFGGAGDDLLNGGSGQDMMVGGAGADTFVFEGTVNHNIIQDFEVGIDKIDLTSYGPIALEDALAVVSEVGGNTMLDLGENGSVLLIGVANSDLNLGDIEFVLDLGDDILEPILPPEIIEVG
ncbi:Leukotoxin [Nymphon striatum]|nr:Leukotoxin [Nymphon striatum]